jgi:hypothetical protein
MGRRNEIVGTIGIIEMTGMIEIGDLGLMQLMSRKVRQLSQRHLLLLTVHGETGTLGTKMECPSAPSVVCEVM